MSMRIKQWLGGWCLGWGAITAAQADYTLNMHPGVSLVSRQIYTLHMIIFWICVVIGLLVFGVMFYAVFQHRHAKGHQAAHFHESTWVEIVWTTIPFIILVAMAVPATRTLFVMSDTSDSDITIKITGYQWYWGYEYLGEGIQFLSHSSTPQAAIQNRAPKGEHYLLEVDQPVVVPIGKKIRFLTTAADVIHSWWVPALGIKRDAIPGFINEAWTRIDKPGTYRGQCAELCGVKHGYMPIVVEAKTEADYQAWLQQQKEMASSAKGT